MTDRLISGRDATHRLDTTMAAAVGTARIFALAQTVAVAWTLRRQVRHPKALAGGVAVLASHGVWAARRGWRSGSIRDETLAWTDGVAKCFAVILEGASWGRSDTRVRLRWSDTFGAVVTSWIGFENPAPWSSAVSTAAWLAAHATSSGSGSTRGLQINEAIGHVSFTMLGHMFGREILNQASGLDAARAAAVSQAARVAAQREHQLHRRVIHDSALQILEAVAGGWDIDDDLLIRRIDYETARLRRLTDGDAASTGVLATDLRTLVDAPGFSALDIRIDVTGLADLIPENLIEPLADATHEALVNATKHAGVGTAEIRAHSNATEIRIDIIDRGCGFDVTSPRRGFGLQESIYGRMRDIGGRATVDSKPEAGTRVTLQVPL